MNELRPRQKMTRVRCNCHSEWKISEKLRGDTTDTTSKPRPVACSFKGSHYVPLSKTVAFLCDYTDAAHPFFLFLS